MGSVLALAFIAGIGAVGVLVGLRPTVADGRVLAADMLEQVKDRGVQSIECDREIPIGVAGAVFACDVAADDGSTARLQYTMNREGAYTSRVLDSTGPTRESPARRVRPGADPWDD